MSSTKKPTTEKTTRTAKQKAAIKPVAKKKVVKKTLAKKKPAPKKTPAKRKPLAKKTTTKAKAAPKVKTKTRAKKTMTTARKKVPAEKVTLPENVSVRAQEKAYVLRDELDAYIQKSVALVAYVSGLAFVFVGAALSLSNVLTGVDAIIFSANTISSVDTEAVENVIDRVPAEPNFTLIGRLPDQVDDEFHVKFSLTDVDRISAKLVNPNKVGFYDLETEHLLDNKYRVTVPARSLPDAYYRLNIYAFAAKDGKIRAYQTDVFAVGDPKDPLRPQEPAPEKPEPEPLPDPVFSIFSNTKSLTGFSTIGLSNTPEASGTYELYARPLHSLEARFVAVSALRFNRPRFDFESANLPNGVYEFYAVGTQRSSGKVSESIQLTVTNAVNSATNNNQTDGSGTSATRPFVSDEDIEYVPSVSLDDDIANETSDIITENKDALTDLFAAYAVAEQGGNEVIIAAAEKTLQEKRESLILEALQDQQTRYIADEIDAELQNFLTEVTEKIERFEQLRVTRDGIDGADTDQDGISDFDEINIYQTDPDLPDTDNDGILDSIELTRGFDPLDATPEAVIEFANPKNSVGITRDDILTVEAITPVMAVDASDSSKNDVNQFEISGRALPNSFVTLYIFSSPTIVTIKTNADGAFTYTFDKELEDGTHEVYVAITDNTGDIVVQSSGFGFVKQAEAFTPIDADSEYVLPVETPEAQSDGDTAAVIGMAILALGLILIMLGVGLRTRTNDSDTNHIIAT